MPLRWLLLVGGALALVSCKPIEDLVAPAVEQHLARSHEAMEGAISGLRNEVMSLKSENQKLTAKIASLEIDRSFLQAQIEAVFSSPAIVKEGGGYGVARTVLGVIPISIENIQPYLDGYRVTFHVGNTTSAALRGAEFEVKWGLPWDTKTATYKQISESQKAKKFSVTTTFPVGAYTAVDATLTPAKPEEVRTISILPILNQIAMRQPSSRQ